MNVLSDPLFSAMLRVGELTRVDLPTLLAGYADDQVLDLPFVRPHQRSPWHSFCVQLAALALHHAGPDEIPTDAETWRGLLRGLTLEWPDDEPWCLVVEDVSKPAFLQPPVPIGSGDPHKTSIATADDLDVLVTAKNHGVKQGVGADASPAAWVAALVLLQTTGGFLGAGNYGIARMNGGFATRPWVGLVPEGGLGAHWRRDVTLLLRDREGFLDRFDAFAETEGGSLLWCLPWDGKSSLALDDLDPWFIEVCRRVRLYRDGTGAITARSVGSSAPRINAKAYKGNVGDPWIPINLAKESAAYNTAPSYQVMSEVLFDRNWRRPLLLEWHEGIDRAPMTARFDVMVRGQGVTEGQHLRELRLDDRHLRCFGGEERDRLALLSKEMVEHARTLRNKVLKMPLLTLVQAGAEAVDFRDKTAGAWVQPWLDQVDDAIEPAFFDYLFARADDEHATRAWALFLRESVDEIFARAAAAVPIAGARRLKAIVVAQDRLGGLFHKNFGDLMQPLEMADA